MNKPIAYESSMETPEPDEAKTTAELIETLLKISRITYQDGHHALRSVHAKSHALLKGEFRVLPNLAAELAQGVFAQPASFASILRFSSTPGDLLNDSVSTPRGLAIKVIGIPGTRLPGSETDTTQDFVLVDGPAFAAPNAKSFLKHLKRLAGTTDKVPGLKSVLSAALRGVENLVESVGGDSGTLKSLGGHPSTHPLGETFYSQVPILYGPYMAKIAVVPLSPELARLKGVHVNITHAPNALRDALTDFFSVNAAIWEVRVQLCRDLEKMPIENSAVVWPEDVSAFQPVAHLVVGTQPAWSAGRSAAVDDATSFSPWHGVAAHRPLGSIMRVRRSAYAASAQFRSAHNRCPITEPVDSDAIQ